MADLKELFCVKCKKPVYRSFGRFHESIKFGWKTYCSRKCEYKYKTKKRGLACENCGKPFERRPKEFSAHNYCSQSCAAIVNNRMYPKRHPEIKFKICQACGQNYRKSTGNKKYCSLKCRQVTRWWSAQKLIEMIKKTAQKLERVPTRRELDSIQKSCIKFFGSWNNAVLAAGLTPNRSHDNRMYKRSNAKALDGHRCDSISELLIDNWLHESNIPHKRDASYPDTHHKADWEILSKDRKIFVEYFGLANDSPRYDRAVKEKKELCRKHKVKLIEIYHWDLYPKKGFETRIKNKIVDL